LYCTECNKIFGEFDVMFFINGISDFLCEKCYRKLKHLEMKQKRMKCERVFMEHKCNPDACKKLFDIVVEHNQLMKNMNAQILDLKLRIMELERDKDNVEMSILQ